EARSCGPYPGGCWFTAHDHPDLPLDPFARGDVGIVKGTWARSYRIVAYRHLAGVGMDAEEQAGALRLWRDRLALQTEQGGPDAALFGAIASWHAARSRIGAAPDVAPYKIDPESESWIGNCREDAFLTAARALESRIAKSGVDAPEVL